MRRKKTTDQYAEAKRCVFSFDFKNESEDECLRVMRADLGYRSCGDIAKNEMHFSTYCLTPDYTDGPVYVAE